MTQSHYLSTLPIFEILTTLDGAAILNCIKFCTLLKFHNVPLNAEIARGSMLKVNRVLLIAENAFVISQKQHLLPWWAGLLTQLCHFVT